MRKIFLAFMSAFLLVVPVFANDDNTFIIGFDQEFPPYGFVNDDGDFDGFDLALGAEVAERNEWKIVYQPIDWAAKDDELNSGSIDCIWNGFTKSEDRLDQYEWTFAYNDNSQVFVVNTDSGITTFADLSGKVVEAQAASSALEAIESDENADLKASFANLITVPDYNTALMDLEAGACDAVAMDITVAKFQISDRKTNFTIMEEPLAPEQYAVAFKLGNTELRDKVQDTLREMIEDGTCAKISEKYFDGEDTCIIEE